MCASGHKRAFLRAADVRFTRKSGRRNRTDTPTYRQIGFRFFAVGLFQEKT
jgi:hypothetical protein